MALESGHKLGPYEIVGPVGAGGMGEVYKAVDTRLDRTVAVKVLPHHLSENEQLRARFDREARTISNLSHPNICALHDVGHDGGIDYLVMEYIEGETLAQRLSRGPLASDDILKLGIEICNALEAAHRSNVVHRDLKPGNVMLTRTGVKLLDFGLAKLADADRDVVSSALTDMVTRQQSDEPLTGQGTILGTFQYMAPEQVEGKEVDARADVFALGAILYEMATGRKAFEGASQASLIAAILERTPPAISTIQPMAPPALDHLVRACLAKDPDDRIQTAHDVGLQLRWIREGGSQVGVPGAVARARRRWGRLAWILVAALAVTTAALLVMLLGRAEPERITLAAEIALPDGLDPVMHIGGGSFALSPDGRRLAVSALEEEGGVTLWVRNMASGEVHRLSERGWFPFWSPDSRNIAFFTDGKLKRIDADGGSAVTVCDVVQGRGGSWNARGTIVFAYSTTDGIYRVPDGGGEATRITVPDTTAGIQDHRFPWFLPDGEHFLFTARGPTNASLCVGSLAGGEPKTILPVRSHGVFTDEQVLYVRENTLVARPFDLSSLAFAGDARIVVEPVGRHDGYTHASFAASNTGVLVYGGATSETGDNIVVYARNGARVETIESDTDIDELALSRDGGMLAVTRYSGEASGYDLWTYDLERRLFTRVTFENQCDDPTFSPDGNRIAYSSGGNLASVRTSGAGDVTPLYESANDDLPTDWSLDGGRVLFLTISSKNREDVCVYDFETGEAKGILTTTYREMHPKFSPDGRWIAYASDESGRQQVYVIDYPGLAQKIQVSRDGGEQPLWRGDGRELYFTAADDSIKAVSVATAEGHLRLGQPRGLFKAEVNSIRTHQYAVAPGGDLFYIIEPRSDVEVDVFRVLVGWQAAAH